MWYPKHYLASFPLSLPCVASLIPQIKRHSLIVTSLHHFQRNKERPSHLSTPNSPAGATILTLFSELSADSRSLDSCTASLFVKSSVDFRFPRTIPPTHFAAPLSIQGNPATFLTNPILLEILPQIWRRSRYFRKNEISGGKNSRAWLPTEWTQFLSRERIPAPRPHARLWRRVGV